MTLAASCFGDRVWLIGGTQESAQLSVALSRFQLPCIVTVTTESAKALYPITQSLQIWVGRLDVTRLEEFLQEQGIVAILDASHPYAVEISKMAIAISLHRQIPYLRYERPAVDAEIDNNQQVIRLDSFETLLTGDYLQEQRVLLTIGYRNFPLFRPWQEKSTLFARILPSVTAMDAAYAAGFAPDRLIALRPPVPAELEKALWHHWKISLVVTKASGTAGGEDVKRRVATELGIPLVVITRPEVAYPQQTSDIEAAVEFCRYHLK
jgi:precorrin-6A/cobalt-precorrin-6A reductase